MKLFASRNQHRHHPTTEAEVSRLRTENARLLQAQAEELGRQLRAMETIDRLTAERAELTARLATMIRWANDVDIVNTCLTETNGELTAEVTRLRRELAERKAPAARVIPLQNRGAA